MDVQGGYTLQHRLGDHASMLPGVMDGIPEEISSTEEVVGGRGSCRGSLDVPKVTGDLMMQPPLHMSAIPPVVEVPSKLSCAACLMWRWSEP